MTINILAASLDGFVSGIVIASIQQKTGYREFFKVFGIVFACCYTAAYSGYILSLCNIQRYTSIAAAIILLYLAVKPFVFKGRSIESGLYAVSFSVAADASVVCIMLAADGYSILLTSFLSAITHSLFMFCGIKISKAVLRDKFSRYMEYISSFLFLLMAIYKMKSV